MDPLITNGIDPALLRVTDKRGQEREAGMRRKRTMAATPARGQDQDQSEDQNEEREQVGVDGKDKGNEADPELLKHQLDDLA